MRIRSIGGIRAVPRGIRLIKWAERNNLVLKNSGDSPTCVRPQGTSVVDLTWTTPNMVNRITNWTVEESYLSLSDHNYITFTIKGKTGRGPECSGW